MTQHDAALNEDIDGWLVATDIDAIQSYLLQSVHLHTIAGASNLVVSADEELRRRAANPGDPAEKPGEVIVASGGIGLVEFRGKTEAAAFAEAMTDWFREQSVSGHMSVSEPQAIGPQKAFGEYAAAAFKALERRKRAGHRQGEVATLPQGRICQSCGEELASEQVSIGRPPDVERRWLGAACRKKHDRFDRYFWLNWLRNSADDRSASWRAIDPKKIVPHDFNKLAGDHDLGLIVADADGTGRVLKQLAACGKQAWKDFSQRLAALSEGSLTHAINDIVPQRSLDDPDAGYLPVLPLFCGGDDFVIACRGDLALPLASSLCRFFAEQPKERWCPGKHLGLSAAVVVTRPGFPFRIAHRIANELLHNAKREAKRMGWSKEGVGAIEYALITESMGDAEAILSDRIIDSDRKHGKQLTLHLSGRAYKAAAFGPRSIGGLAGAVAALQADKFPRGKLHELRVLCARTSWASSGARPTQTETNELRQQIEWSYRDWLRRTLRQPNLAETLKKVEEHLEHSLTDAEASFWLPRGDLPADSGEYRTPLGDLADAARLFGNLDKKPEADDEMPD